VEEALDLLREINVRFLILYLLKPFFIKFYFDDESFPGMDWSGTTRKTAEDWSRVE